MDHIIAAIHEAAAQQQQQMFQSPFPLMQLQLGGGNYDHAQYISGYGQPIGNYPQPVQGPFSEKEQEYAEDDDEDDEQQRTLFCGNLDERVSEEILYEVFLTAGPIESARIPLDPAGRQRTYGFITYQHACAVPFALELYQGLELFQKKVTIKHQGTPQPSSRDQDQQQRSRNRNPFNPFMPDTSSPSGGASRHMRHSLHDAKPYDRQQDLRRRSDSAVMDRNRSRHHQHQSQNHHNHNTGGNRRSEQRNQGKRRL
ncbi:uncharacterized protein Dwil_GK24608 [Drosophila willistoni]|uniref:RRM domain-containing protein n=1 Tax=Drosophila willistoni TaxID=7260 RepID=B4N0M8_DROWI|nr:RNA-binding protein 7 [Drosophila willistoni]EDW77641.1 uncharacterized protein Dwil_GK24608 [Drosophila willistoni]